MKTLWKWFLRLAGATVALLSVALLALFFAGHRDGAGHVQASIEIDRKPEQVFAHFTDVEKFKKWVPYAKEITIDGGELREGAKVHLVIQLGDDLTPMDEEVLALEPNRRLELHLQSPPGESQGFVEHEVFSLDELGGHTRGAAGSGSTYRGL